MFRKLKKRLKEWAEEVQRRELARLHEQNMKLKAEIERETGRPVQLTPEERNRLAQISKGMDPETLEQILMFDPKES